MREWMEKKYVRSQAPYNVSVPLFESFNSFVAGPTGREYKLMEALSKPSDINPNTFHVGSTCIAGHYGGEHKELPNHIFTRK